VFDDRGYWACEFVLDGRDLENHPIQPGTMWSMNVIRTRIGPASEMCGIWPTFGASSRRDLYPIAIFTSAEAPETQKASPTTRENAPETQEADFLTTKSTKTATTTTTTRPQP